MCKVKSMLLIWSLGTHRFHLWALNFPMSFSDLTKITGYQDSISSNDHQMTWPISSKQFTMKWVKAQGFTETLQQEVILDTLSSQNALWVFILNPLNPVHGITNVCHQVRCMYWGHISLFHRSKFPFKSISNGLHGRFIIWICLGQIDKFVFHASAIWGTQVFSLKKYHSFTRTLQFLCLWISTMPPNSIGNMHKHSYLWCFGTVATKDIHVYPRFILFSGLCWLNQSSLSRDPSSH